MAVYRLDNGRHWQACSHSGLKPVPDQGLALTRVKGFNKANLCVNQTLTSHAMMLNHVNNVKANMFFRRVALDLESLHSLRWLQGPAHAVLVLVLLLFVM